MDSNNWRSERLPADGDWRSQLQNYSRERIVFKMMDAVKCHRLLSGQEGNEECMKIARRFEEKIFHESTSQSDYLRRVSLKMFTMESEFNPPDTMQSAIPSNSAGISRNPQDPASSDSTSQTTISELQEDVYLKIQVMKDLYYSEIHGIHQKTCSKIQQVKHDSLSQQAKSDGIERLKYFKEMLERILQCLQMSRSAAQHFQKDKLAGLEKQILNIINSHRPRKPAQPHENVVNSQLQSLHGQGDMSAMNGPVSSLTGIKQQYEQQLQHHQQLLHNQQLFQQQQQQQMMQSQTGQWQQHLGLPQQPNSLQQNMQQRLQSSNALLQQQNVIDPQKMFHSQRTPTEAPSTSLDSTAQTSISESQEEVYQKMKVMKDLYFQEIHDIYQKICLKIQQHDSLSQQAKLDGIERLKYFKQMLERILQCLQMSRSAAQHFQKDKLAGLEKQILGVLNSHRPRKPAPPMQQGQISQSHMQSHSQITQAQSHENGGNSQLQSIHGQGDMSGMNGAVSSLTGITSSQPNMMNSLQPASSLESGQGNAPNSIQQNPLNPPQQATPQTGVNLMHPSTNMLQSQHIKQQHEQQLKQQLQHRQQLIHKQQLFQQQQQQQQQQHLQMQQIKQQPGQVQMPQIQQMNDVNDIKVRQNVALKQQGLLPQHGQRYQQLKPGVSFPNSSPQLLQTGSPQINQHSSPQIDQQNLLPPLNKVGTPLQSANSPFIPSMSPLAPSPMPGDPEKPNIIQQTNIAPASASSLAIGTPGISASPLLAESSPPDGQFTTLNSLSGRSDQPLDRLLKVVKSMSTKALNSAVDDIVSVVSMIDRIAGSAPGNGSRAAVGEDLVAMTKCRLQARNFITQDGSSGMKRMRRYTSAMPLNVASSVGSANNSFKQLIGADTSELESTATSGVKRRRIEVNPAILDEIKDTNEHLIDTVVDLSDEDVDPTLSAVATEGGEGTIIKCTFNAVSLSPNLKSQYCSAQMSPIQPLRLLVPANYPNCSPILLDKFPVEVSKEYDDISVKVKSRFSISLRTLSQPMSLREMARTWDDCARCVITEFAQQSGGGTFSSKYGSWENCLSAS